MLWSVPVGVGLNAIIVFILASLGSGTPHGGAAWLVFASFPILFVIGIVMFIVGAVLAVRARSED